MGKQMSNSSSAQPSEGSGIRPAALKLPDACTYCGGVSEISLRRAIKRGLLKPCRGFRHILIPIAELDRFLAQ